MEAQKVMSSILGEKLEKNERAVTKKVAGIPEKNKLYTPVELIEFDDKRKKEIEKEKQEKLEKKRAKEEAKREKEELVKAKKLKKEQIKKLQLEEKEEKKKLKEELKEIKENTKKLKELRNADSDSSELSDDLDEDKENNISTFSMNIVNTRKRTAIDYNKLNTSGCKKKKM